MNIGIDEQTKARLQSVILGFESAKSKGYITVAEQRMIQELNQRIQVEINLCNNVDDLKFWELLENAFYAIKKQLFRQESLNTCLVSENIQLKTMAIIENAIATDLIERFDEMQNHCHNRSTDVMRIQKVNKSLLRTNNRLKNDRKTEKRIIRKSRHAAAVSERNKVRSKTKRP
jgi:hypothetical protein